MYVAGTPVVSVTNLIHFSVLVKCPTPMRNRDFVTQRSWYWKDDDFIIFNHTVHHKVHVTKLYILVFKMFDCMGCTSNNKEGLFGSCTP